MRVSGAMLVAVLVVYAAIPSSAADLQPMGYPVKAFFEAHCTACHAGTKPKGDFLLDALSMNFADEVNRERWLKVVEQLTQGTMPPAEKPRPPEKDVAALVRYINSLVATAES